MRVKKKSAMETLLVECVDGKPYSRWWVPIAVLGSLGVSVTKKL